MVFQPAVVAEPVIPIGLQSPGLRRTGMDKEKSPHRAAELLPGSASRRAAPSELLPHEFSEAAQRALIAKALLPPRC